jgi:ubiquitin carboxyl-terminal hydrolase 20/33
VCLAAAKDDGTGRGALPPGPIDNSSLLKPNGEPKGSLRAVTHYRGVNAAVWSFFHDIYGGGPMMRRARRIDIFAPPIDPIPVDLLGSVPPMSHAAGHNDSETHANPLTASGGSVAAPTSHA